LERIGVTIEKVLNACQLLTVRYQKLPITYSAVLNVLTPYCQPVSRWYYIAGSYRMKYATSRSHGYWDKAADNWE
jgi:hypothetical protein